MSDTVPKLRLRGVRKRFGDKIVLDGIDLEVMPRTSLVIIGGSGSGKSVLLKCILGLIEPDTGSIEIDGRDLMTMPRVDREAARAQIGMLFQNGALFDSLPVWENVGVRPAGAGTRSVAPRRRHRPLHSWHSWGWRKASDNCRPPNFGRHAETRGPGPCHRRATGHLFFDEPTTGLDPIMGAIIDGLIVDCVKRLGSTAVAITHDMASAKRIGDQAAMIHKGRIIWNGLASALMNSGDPIVDQFTHGRREGPIEMELRR